MILFRCALASQQEGVSLGRSISPSVRPWPTLLLKMQECECLPPRSCLHKTGSPPLLIQIIHYDFFMIFFRAARAAFRGTCIHRGADRNLRIIAIKTAVAANESRILFYKMCRSNESMIDDISSFPSNNLKNAGFLRLTISGLYRVLKDTILHSDDSRRSLHSRSNDYSVQLQVKDGRKKEKRY